MIAGKGPQSGPLQAPKFIGGRIGAGLREGRWRRQPPSIEVDYKPEGPFFLSRGAPLDGILGTYTRRRRGQGLDPEEAPGDGPMNMKKPANVLVSPAALFLFALLAPCGTLRAEPGPWGPGGGLGALLPVRLEASEAFAADALLPVPLGAAAAGQVVEEDEAYYEEPKPKLQDRAHRFIGKVGIGFTTSPELLLLAAEVDWFITEHIAIGPLVQAGLPEDPFIIASTINVKALFDIPPMPRLKPFVQGGIGGAYLYEEIGDCCQEGSGLLLNAGGGFEVFLSGTFALGSEVLFNFMPQGVIGEHFFFSWQVVTLSLMF